MAGDDKIEWTCEGCGQLLKAKPELAGRKGKCPKCREPFVIPPPHGDGAGPPPLPKKGKALGNAALICGIAALAYPGSILGLLAIPSLICGHYLLWVAKQSEHDYTGLTRARWGVALSYVAIAMFVWLLYSRITTRRALQEFYGICSYVHSFI